jgi:hypothetical protein
MISPWPEPSQKAEAIAAAGTFTTHYFFVVVDVLDGGAGGIRDQFIQILTKPIHSDPHKAIGRRALVAAKRKRI